MKLVVLFGPPAVGKMTVGYELEHLTGLRLLSAPLAERLRRNETEFRLAEKRPKRNLEESTRNLLATEQKWKLNTSGDFFYPDRHLCIDNTDLQPDVVARRIAEWIETFEVN